MKAKIPSEKIFYVYEHWRLDKNVCFYVGKGKGKRAWDLKNMRNQHHRNITQKLMDNGFIVHVKIVADCLSEKESFELEKKVIAFYGVENLSNLTGGGDGLQNVTDETRKKISESQKRRFANPLVRQQMSIARKGKMTSEETKKKLSIAGKVKKHTDAVRAKMKEAAKKRSISSATRIAQKIAVTGKKRAPFTDETKKKMSEAAKVREAMKKNKVEN